MPTGERSEAMKKIVLSLLISLPALLLMATTLEAMTSTNNDSTPAPAIGVDLGRGDFMNYCAACHGATGVGDGTVAEFLTLTPANLTLLTKRNAGQFPRERITEVIDGRVVVKVHGLRDMPIWGDWFRREASQTEADKAHAEDIANARIKALVDFIETLQAH